MNYKQVILVRMDLKMPKGKLAVQVGHACVDCALNSPREKVETWYLQGMKKIVLKLKNLAELKKYQRLADKSGLVNCVIKDAGMTVFKKPTITCLGIGPDKEDLINTITSELKML